MTASPTTAAPMTASMRRGRAAAGLRRALLLGSVLVGTQPALARPSTTAMTCAEAVGFVRARGAVVLGTGGPTYDRFVRDRSFCEPTEIAKRAFRPTRDDPACLVGYTCYEPGATDRLGDDF